MGADTSLVNIRQAQYKRTSPTPFQHESLHYAPLQSILLHSLRCPIRLHSIPVRSRPLRPMRRNSTPLHSEPMQLRCATQTSKSHRGKARNGTWNHTTHAISMLMSNRNGKSLPSQSAIHDSQNLLFYAVTRNMCGTPDTQADRKAFPLQYTCHKN